MRFLKIRQGNGKDKTTEVIVFEPREIDPNLLVHRKEAIHSHLGRDFMIALGTIHALESLPDFEFNSSAHYTHRRRTRRIKI
jgi:hypothetical protein